MEKAKPAAPSVSLFGFGGPQKTADTSPSVPAPKPSPKSVAPRGVPTISKWRQNRDGSISGFITGSSAFQSGEAITTSPITGEGVGGAVVQTTSGSRYEFLFIDCTTVLVKNISFSPGRITIKRGVSPPMHTRDV